MNLANRLTMLRLILIPFYMIFIIPGKLYMPIASLFIFIAAGITDLYDGAIARKTNTVTTLGIFLDPLADKLLISAAFISFVDIPEISVPAWMIVLIISREFIITGLRLVAASKGRVLPATRAGKFKTSSQVTAIITILTILSINYLLFKFGHIPIGSLVYSGGPEKIAGVILAELPYWLIFAITILTVISGVSYLRKNIDILKEA